MKNLRAVITILVIMFYSAIHAEEENPVAKLAWQLGPGEGTIGDKAKIKIPEGFAFLGSEDTKKYMELLHNIPGDNEYVFAPTDMSWFAIFHFDPVGYVKDNETLDANAVLESVKQGTEQGNEERRKRGWATMSVVGWRFQPQYDKQMKLLEWAILAKEDSTHQDIINYNTRLLGRAGVMEVILVAAPESLDTSVATLKTVLSGYDFVAGQKYAEYKQGDRVAEFGLAALIAGGAAAVAAKKGFFAVIAGFLAAAWKFVVAAAIGVIAWLKSFFGKKDK